MRILWSNQGEHLMLTIEAEPRGLDDIVATIKRQLGLFYMGNHPVHWYPEEIDGDTLTMQADTHRGGVLNVHVKDTKAERLEYTSEEVGQNGAIISANTHHINPA